MTFDGTNRTERARIQDPSSDHEAHVSHFGVLKAGATIPILKANFPGTSLDTLQWNQEIVSGGSTTVADGMGQLSTSTNSAGSIKLKTNFTGQFEAGQVTVFQSGVRAGTGQTTIGAITVPTNTTLLIKRIRTAITRANGSSGSATVELRVRNRGEAWRSIRVFEVQTGAPTEFTAVGGDVIIQESDIKFTITQVSDNNTIVDGALEYLEIDN
jgi:hypothetical protein